VRRRLLEWFYRLAATGLVPRRLFAPRLPDPAPGRPARHPTGGSRPTGSRPGGSTPRPSGAPVAGSPADAGAVTLEIVSHCWRYDRLLAYQLSSLALHPPRSAAVTMTVFYAPEDEGTAALLDRFGRLEVPGVRWSWRPLERERLFRRAIGRNLAAQATQADWVWFSDCDVVFHEGALDAAATVLRGRDDVLVFPRQHRVSDILEPDDPLLAAPAGEPGLVAIDPGAFHAEVRDKAVGGFQIVRGDVARAVGYCGDIAHYQRPVPRWTKTYEDRTFRWLLGTDGTPVDIPGLYRIRHAARGRDPASMPAGTGRGGPGAEGEGGPPDRGVARPGGVVGRVRGWLRRRRQGPTGRQR
jgi:hypothetical protein